MKTISLLLTIALMLSFTIAACSALKCYTGVQQTGMNIAPTVVDVGNSTSTYVCARYETSVAFVSQKIFTYTFKDICESWQKTSTYQKVTCCNTDLCNGSVKIVGSALMMGLVMIASFVLL